MNQKKKKKNPGDECMRLRFERIITWLSRAPTLPPASGSEIQVEANIQKIYSRQFQDRCGKKYEAEEQEKNRWRHCWSF